MADSQPNGPAIRALEFFSGIGGMHYGLEWAGVDAEVLASFDINHIANECYQHNFGIAPIQTAIQAFTASYVESFGANCWLMSPPCQPYTKGGKRLDDQDPRALGLLRLTQILHKLKSPPNWIFLENVLLFEESRSRDLLVSTLRSLNYEILEWLLTPLQFGVPNDRKRFYMTARRLGTDLADADGAGRPEYTGRVHRDWPFEVVFPRRPIGSFLSVLSAEEQQTWTIPEVFVKKRQYFSDRVVATPDEYETMCFTKAYGHHGVGAGTFLQTKGFDDPKRLEEPSTAIERLGLRLFTPLEIARLHAFPIDSLAPQPPQSLDAAAAAAATGGAKRHSFEFPATLSTIQRFRLLGNSMNVLVVGELMRNVLFADRQHWDFWTNSPNSSAGRSEPDGAHSRE
ncbi:S-adenosyl-L-methionine-dependent methyltransferase [Polychytrium aggregatum]|uniref:S-adenosyl-L-methionine-dependent methyltransferase n=1 Tax=Polychytrium aggregatum TaxID=110093 RepID=UPI0022FDF1EE|nr:S-adenosyl-L-methionine-dependent methyltransferase [Polychytrium aggregatum]KAI9197207.1 S-adenosyl-L-methionine-dependent methyltransferase [Polychytrium aggregatum]